VSDLAALRQRLLEAREMRQAAVARACTTGRSVIVVSVNVPGPDKCLPGVRCLVRLAGEALGPDLAAQPVAEGSDALGPWAMFSAELSPAEAKRAAIDIETTLPAGRLLDIDVYDPAGGQVDRASLGLPARPCLICTSPAVECIRVGRHAAKEVVTGASRLLLRVLALALVRGARTELDLTPKPGLVDRLDSGSHPDLSFDDMSRSIDLLPAYFDDLLGLDDPLDLRPCVAAGERAERRMTDAIGSNSHKGYIFLSGLVLLAARTATGPRSLRSNASTLARRILGRRIKPAPTSLTRSHGHRARADHGVGGIVREALQGLPSVFDCGLPVLAASRGLAAKHLLMAMLMQSVEDTTAVHRCGMDGLARLRADGLRLQRRIESGDDYGPWLVALNDEYRRLTLTMGGVADCMALCFALHEWFGL
jgi:triphosphoribosyl-dephospho-CoA synthase